ncbi:MAG: DUF4249 family protein [Cytophagales bacterium]|nr:DUF4249 family protein [Cytophagales bacterium]
MKKINIPIHIIMLLMLQACFIYNDFENEAEIPRLPYTPKLAVECYLEPGKPYRLLLTQTVDYFDTAIVSSVAAAQVKIVHGNNTQILTFSGARTNSYAKIYNYRSNTLVPNDTLNAFELNITDTYGNNITASTYIPGDIRLDTMYYEVNTEIKQDSVLKKINFRAKITVQNEIDDVYRLFFNRGSSFSDTLLNTRYNQIHIDTTKFVSQTDTIYIFTDAGFRSGDTVTINLHRSTKDYYYYYRTTRSAFFANLNPFSTPQAIVSNIKGGIGIFTGMRTWRKKIVLGDKSTGVEF